MVDTPAFTEAWLPGYDGLQFHTRTYQAATPKAVLLFVHGFAEHVGRYDHVLPTWKDRGVTLFTYDQRGFGRTALDKSKSKESAYGKTSWRDQLSDIEWWLKHLRTEHPTLPLFLMGHSMGGGLVLAFPTRIYTPPSKETVAMLSGVISSSPLIHQTFPASKALRFFGGKAGSWLPYMTISAPVAIEDLSHDPAANEANAKDPLIIQKGSLRGLDDMLSGGEKLLQKDFQHWPKKLPLLLVHGTGDRITSPKASEEFIHKIDAEDKQLSLYPDGFHELVQEPNGVKEKYVDECISWVLAHLPQSEVGEQTSTPLPPSTAPKL